MQLESTILSKRINAGSSPAFPVGFYNVPCYVKLKDGIIFNPMKHSIGYLIFMVGLIGSLWLALSSGSAMAPQPVLEDLDSSFIEWNRNYSPIEAKLSEQDEIQRLIRLKYPELSECLIRLGNCESQLIMDICGDHGNSCGVFQIQYSTFVDFGCSGQWLNLSDQIDCTVKMIKLGVGPTTGGWYNCFRRANLWHVCGNYAPGAEGK